RQSRRTLIRLSKSRGNIVPGHGERRSFYAFTPGSRQRWRGQSRGDPACLALAGATPGPQGRGRAAPNTHADSGGPAPRGQAAVPGTSPGRSRYAGVPSSVAIQTAAGSPPRGRGQVGPAHGGGGSSGACSSFGVAVRRGSGDVGWCFGTKPVLSETALC